MPKQKDLKRAVRTRMQKTGESYTTARLFLTRKKNAESNYAELAGMSDESVRRQTGRGWREWVAILDKEDSAAKTHREIARHVRSLGMTSWWSQTVTVGYERIRGLRERGQRSDGGFSASKSRTFAVPLSKLYKAFATASLRARWMAEPVIVHSSTPGKRMRMEMADGTMVEIGFTARSETKSSVAIDHMKLPDKAAIQQRKSWWAERFEALGEVLG